MHVSIVFPLLLAAWPTLKPDDAANGVSHVTLCYDASMVFHLSHDRQCPYAALGKWMSWKKYDLDLLNNYFMLVKKLMHVYLFLFCFILAKTYIFIVLSSRIKMPKSSHGKRIKNFGFHSDLKIAIKMYA